MKYLCSFLIPFSTVIGLWFGGPWAWMTVGLVFLGVPLLDMLLGRDNSNMDQEQERYWRESFPHNAILYAYLPIQVGLIFLLGWMWNETSASPLVRLGWVLSVALCTGGLGITVAHELVHRHSIVERWVGRLLLLTVMYMHFAIEHVRGHHAKVATSDDPATAQQGSNVYRFMLTTIPAQLKSAWQLESSRLHKHKWPVWSWRNEMLLFATLQLAWLALLVVLFGLSFIPIYLLVALMSIALLEMINYIEHYGLERVKLSGGRYEPVKEHHSWNSDHLASRALLFELTRHSDHHLSATRPYQTLRSSAGAPELPSGYPGMLLLTLVPPIWYAVMDRRVEQARQSLASGYSTAKHG